MKNRNQKFTVLLILFSSCLFLGLILGCPTNQESNETTTTSTTTTTTTSTAPANTNFISTWNTANTSSGSSAANQITLPFISSGSYDCTVDW